MKKGIYIVAILMLVCSIALCFAACNENPLNDELEEVRGFTDKNNPYLVIYDDFDATEINSELWNVYGKDKGNTPHIRRGAYWDPRQVFIENNALVIRTQKREDGYFYTGAIDSHNKFEKGYGYYEARCKLPKASGLWSAFWLMSKQMEEGTAPGTSDVNLTGAEIDIMESPFYINGEVSGMYQYNVHVGDYGDNYLMYSDLPSKGGHGPVNMVNYSNVLATEEDVSLYDDWHTYALEWTETYYKFYIDRILVATITDMRYVSPLQDFLFLSVEVDGAEKQTKDADGNVIKREPDAFTKQFTFLTQSIAENPESNFPADFLVDWVAVYSQKPF